MSPSSVIRFFRYDAPKRELLIGFQTGRKYVYHDVPEQIYLDMKAAFSKGEFFNAHIRDRFSFTERTTT
jgi:hypothetical protein